MNKHSVRPWLLLPLAFSPSLLFGQSAADQEPVIELSPFQVTGTDDVGYSATSTLGGTRIRTELRDIGASISIVNEEFLRDTNSNNLEDVLVFTPNTEVGGLGGNFSGNTSRNPVPESQRDNQQGGLTRVRGLAAADLTRDYFITDVPFDTFNTDRIDVQRGANSAMFGLGSPGGMINSTIIRANFLKDAGRVRVEADQYGTFRTSTRYNEVVNDRVAFLVAGLLDRTKFEQKQAFSDDDRIYASLAVKATDNIRIHAGYEKGARDAARPDYIPPNDGITPWIQMGKPTFDTPADAAGFFRGTGAFAPGRPNSQFFTTAAAGISTGYAAFYQDPNNPNATFGGTTFVSGTRGAPRPNPGVTELMMIMPFTTTEIIRRSGGYRADGSQVEPGTSSFYTGGFVSSQITDRSIYDYRKNLFSGGASQQWADWDVFTATLEGSWLDERIGFELAYYDQEFNSAGWNPLQGNQQRTLYIDPNRSLIATVDGSPTGAWVPNPNFGQPVMGGWGQGNDLTSNRDSIRATVFGELRANDFLDDSLVTKILGRLRLTGVVQERNSESSSAYGRDKVDAAQVANATNGGNIAGLGVGGYYTGAQYALPFASGTNFLSANSLNDLAGAGIGGVTFGKQRDRTPVQQTFTGWDSAGGRFATFDANTYTLRDNDNFPASFSSSKNRQEIESQVVVGQHYLWDDHVVLTGTWRSDKQSSSAVGAPAVASTVHPGAEDVFFPDFVNGPPSDLTVDADEETTSWSIVLHSPDFINDRLPFGTRLSVYRTKADNFRPSGGRVNIFNESVAPVTGATEENGFIISTFDGKLVARLNWYETGILNNSFENSGLTASEGILLNLARQLDNPANVAQGFTASDVQAVLPPAGVIALNGFVPDFANAEATTNRNSFDTGTQDFTSKGNEFELAYNPTDRWTMIVGVARQQTITSNTYPALTRYVNEFVIPNWVNSNFAKNYFIDELGTVTLAEQATNALVNPVAEAKTQDGTPSIEQREWRATFNTSYRFGRNSGMIPAFLGDFTIGGGVRWEDKVGIGFGVSQNQFGSYALDPNKPFYGPSHTFLDLFLRSRYDLGRNRELTVQLNIKDLTDHDELVPFFANPDGSQLYRILEGRLFTMSATLEF